MKVSIAPSLVAMSTFSSIIGGPPWRGAEFRTGKAKPIGHGIATARRGAARQTVAVGNRAGYINP